ncbi:MAG: bifunctional diaminohydroxyphosphoribosylaminopyrimidine deaminase/5-amino-6-(5-phosphoribosylamino)uracil reductase RibD, partial [Nocardiopsaceae bacterium]|nr:bifunctional diaminohydroxyphosphoribosylaminopyrimidine deaminase/5-amino-6-(5-phosphoribosylamino)uracil reductase RibD [Nocardiopsaceae bacterium]
MTALPAEEAAMRRAIAISAAGLWTASPNPPVGCVLLGPDSQLISEGYHERKGEAHAETHALMAAGHLAKGATAVVTLEPCNHDGRTPACRQALIDAGVSRVVIALLDPTSRGEGGAAALRLAGVDVHVGVLADEARVVLGPWLTALQTRRPVITWSYVISDRGIGAAAEEMPDARRLRLGADANLHADGTVTEAIPGSHGHGILDMHGACVGAGPAAVAASLYENGVRSVLLVGGLDLAAPYLAAGLVDRLYAYLPDGDASRKAPTALPWPQV